MTHIKLKHGQLSRKDIVNEKNLEIYPKNSRCLKSASYDITPTMIAMSSKLGMLEPVYRKKDSQIKDDYYIIVKPKDTVLIVSREYIKMPENIAGYVTSRVSNVVKGFGHISTTIDPNWNGAILIALSNPSNTPLRVNVSNKEANPLATVTFHYLHSSCEKHDCESKQKSMRIDLIRDEISYKTKKGIKAWIRQKLHFKRRKITDFFFEYLENNEDLSSVNSWNKFLNEFSDLENLDNVMLKHFSDYIINENTINKFKQFLSMHKTDVITVLTIITIVTLFVLYKLGVITLQEASFFKP